MMKPNKNGKYNKITDVLASVVGGPAVMAGVDMKNIRKKEAEINASSPDNAILQMTENGGQLLEINNELDSVFYP